MADLDPTLRKAAELIAEIYKQRQEAVRAGKAPRCVVITPDAYDAIQEYRKTLGDLENSSADYMDKYTIFGLEFFIEPDSPCRVR